MITTSLLTLLILLFGFVLGRLSLLPNQVVSDKYRSGLKSVKTKLKRPSPSGIIYRPTAKKLNRDKRIKERQASHDALVETLDNIPELRKAKERLNGN
jgi:hypothetical protein